MSSPAFVGNLLAVLEVLCETSNISDDYYTSKLISTLLTMGHPCLSDFLRSGYSKLLSIACKRGLLATAHIVANFMVANNACCVNRYSLEHELKTINWHPHSCGRQFMVMLLEEVQCRAAAVQLIGMKRKRSVVY